LVTREAGVLELVHLTKEWTLDYGWVRDLNLIVRDGETCALIGPSGCGKTTVLQMINRLIEPTSGRVLLDGVDTRGMDPIELRRRIGYVIQHVGLFPHRTVAGNVATVPSLLGWDRRRTRERVHELLELVGLPPGRFAHVYPHQLSGGEQQLVAVARALCADPPVLLMDEPFSSVDRVTRTRLQDQFLRIQAQVRKVVVIVTHDIDEAVKVGDRIAILNREGILQQHDTPARMLVRPANSFVADFLGPGRALQRLAVVPIDPARLQPPAGDCPAPDVSRTVTLVQALLAMLEAGTDHVRVRDGQELLGILTVHGLLETANDA
jgi:osmoprotectant transport system ATP-binding protein